ncbi:alcohol dehydrogenase catalytic domain-containing protein [Demequina iriomotensis]|uniref:alcohol dehydrogenase catalytic domain-containing protein n=1 Tax=Demequina iriomotensis TaxID=1536641 RepID=UPI0009E54B6E|nr:alcohol dehydrogenase catalytic domain-containing protein [Demequina iriomotensis]
MTIEAPTIAAVVGARDEDPVLTEVRLDTLRGDEVLVDIAASGVCHTDLTAIDGGVPVGYPMVLGHEGAGTVVATGAAVAHVAVGDRVVLTFDSCGTCARCRDRHPAACVEFASRNYRGARPDGSPTMHDADGRPLGAAWLAQSSWSTRAIARAANTVPIGDEIPFALAAALGCGVLTGAGTVLNVLRPGLDDGLLVIGAGTVGLAAVMAARAAGCARIVVVEPSEARRALALELGAQVAIAPAELDPRAHRCTRALDTVGTQGAIDAALGALAAPGMCATVALRPGANAITVSQTALLWGRSLVGVIEGDAVPATAVPMLVRLWRAGLLPLERLVTRFPFGHAAEAVRAARSGEAVKPVLVMHDDARDAATPPVRTGTAATRVRAIAAAGHGDADELAALWDVLPAVRSDDLRGLWRGTGIDTGHRVHAMLTRASWYGKDFVDGAHVQPLVCRDAAGALRADAELAGGGAWLADCEHRGKVTAAMSYDARPTHDHFVRVDADAVLGVMAGRGALDGGRPYFFLLEREADAGGVA